MIDVALLREKLNHPTKIVITTHHKPDGDAMGSSLGLYNYLLQKGHTVHVITPTDYPYFLHWLPNNPEVLVYTEKKAESEKLVAEAELIFCLDFNDLRRINELGEVVGRAAGLKVMIDHHLEPEGFDDFRYWNINAVAASQLVYQFITEVMNDKALISRDVATCLYTGIMTDSGSFRFRNTTAEVHRIAASLIEAGADNAHIHELIYDNASENRLRFLGFCLSSRLEVLAEYHTALISVARPDIDRFNIATGDTEGIVNYALSLNGIKLAAFIVERADRVKLSLRSTGDFPANEICKKYFNGGGHRNAAGGHSEQPFTRVVQEFKHILPSYKNLLNQ